MNPFRGVRAAVLALIDAINHCTESFRMLGDEVREHAERPLKDSDEVESAKPKRK